jgi:hypothetical protein
MSHIILPNLEKLLLHFYLEPESHLPDVTIVIPTLHWFSDSEMLEESAPMTINKIKLPTQHWLRRHAPEVMPLPG